MGRTPVLTTFRTGDEVVDRNLDHFKQTLNPVLRNPLLAAADFRWLEIAASSASATPTFALQYRTQETWATILTLDATGKISQPAWIAPTLLNSWVNYGGVTQRAGYLKDSLGFVRLRGIVMSGSAVPSTIFTLPAGYVPAHDVNVPTVSNDLFGKCAIIASTGAVTASVGSTVYFSLDGISFDTR